MSLPNEDELATTSFIDTLWLQYNQLNKDTALNYFQNSTFYDKSSINEQCRMQNIPPDQMEEVMRSMRGIEYVLQSASEPILYVIRKQYRHSRSSTSPLALYYILIDTIYQSPTIGGVAHSRLVKSLFHLTNAFKELSTFVSFSPISNYTWDKQKFPEYHKQLQQQQLLNAQKSSNTHGGASLHANPQQINNILDLLTKQKSSDDNIPKLRKQK